MQPLVESICLVNLRQKLARTRQAKLSAWITAIGPDGCSAPLSADAPQGPLRSRQGHPLRPATPPGRHTIFWGKERVGRPRIHRSWPIGARASGAPNSAHDLQRALIARSSRPPARGLRGVVASPRIVAGRRPTFLACGVGRPSVSPLCACEAGSRRLFSPVRPGVGADDTAPRGRPSSARNSALEHYPAAARRRLNSPASRPPAGARSRANGRHVGIPEASAGQHSTQHGFGHRDGIRFEWLPGVIDDNRDDRPTADLLSSHPLPDPGFLGR
jgi:hypothetical protein